VEQQIYAQIEPIMKNVKRIIRESRYISWPNAAWTNKHTPFISNCKSFQESCRVKTSQVWPNLYDKIIIFTIPSKYH
jgi:hypothetical protein